MKAELGRRYRDRVTGFEGVATSRTEFLQGCERVGLERLNEKGDGIISLAFDLPNLELIEAEPMVVESPSTPRGTGGPHDHDSILDSH